MATQTVVCPECDAPVPYGRLSCISCGSLLASVTGGPRRSVAVAPARPVRADDEPPLVAASVDEPTAHESTAHESTAHEPTADDPPVHPPADDVEPAVAPGDIDDAAEPAPPEVELPSEEPVAPDPYGADDDTDVLPAIPTPAPGPPAHPTAEATPPPAPSWPPATVGWPPPAAGDAGQPTWATADPGGGAAGAVAAAGASGAGGAVAAARVPAGAWLPPSALINPDTLAAAAPSKRARPGTAPLLADLPFDAPDDAAGWLVTIGSAIALVGFLLPWAPFMLGAKAAGGYTDGWGLATPSHLLAVALVALTLGLSFVPNRISAWLRSGALGLVVGGLLVGLAWPYLLVLPGAGIGVMAVAFAGALVAAGGLLAVRPRRHAGDQRPV